MDPGSHEDQVCPRVTYDCGNRTVESLAGSLATCCILVASSAMSCLGAILILVAYAALKDIRKGAQTIITILALADLVYSISLIVAGINYFAYYKETEPENCEVYQIVCKIQGFVTLLGSWSTFVWTSALAFYFFMLYVFKAASLAMKLMPLYNILAWGLPVTIALPLLILDKLGLYPGWLVCCTKTRWVFRGEYTAASTWWLVSRAHQLCICQYTIHCRWCARLQTGKLHDLYIVSSTRLRSVTSLA